MQLIATGGVTNRPFSFQLVRGNAMSSLHVPGLLAISQAVPFTVTEAGTAERLIMGRYSRVYLQATLAARRALRNALRVALAGGHYLQAVEHAYHLHSVGVQAVILIRRNARACK